MISKQSIFVSDRTAKMQFSTIQNKIYGPFVMVQYHTKCTNPLYPKFKSENNKCLYFVAAAFTWSLLMF